MARQLPPMGVRGHFHQLRHGALVRNALSRRICARSAAFSRRRRLENGRRKTLCNSVRRWGVRCKRRSAEESERMSRKGRSSGEFEVWRVTFGRLCTCTQDAQGVHQRQD
eukprot:scaffold6180_cov200-Pinguiococcus_pyrenoidosus.AAC.6